MAVPANTLTTYDTVGIREDLSNIISNISPTETPFTSNAGKGPKPKSRFYEWELDALAAVDTTNAQLEGDDVAADAAVQPSRVGNHCQISRKALRISDTEDEMDIAGRDSEWSYQIAKKGKELKRDIEAICVAKNQGATTGSNAAARKTATLLSYVRTNVDKAGDGANPSAPAPSYAGTRTDGTTRAFTETIFKSFLQTCFATGVDIDGSTLMLGAAQKQVFSGFSGIATKFKNIDGNKPGVTIGATDVYVSDFGSVYAVPNRFQRNRDAWLLDFNFIKLRDLRPYRVKDLAKTGDSEAKFMVREWSLQVVNEAGCGLIADLI